MAPWPGDGALLPEQWVRMIEVCPDAVLVVDAERRIRGWNQAATELFGYANEEAIGQPFDLLVPEEQREAGELDRLTAWNEDGGTVRELLTERQTRTGQRVIVRLSRQVLRDEAGEVVGAIAILRDVTDTEQAMRHVAESVHLARLGRLASQIAHEMRNPLAGIHGALQILSRRTDADDPSQEVYAAVGDEVRRLDRLVADLQRFARPRNRQTMEGALAPWLAERVSLWESKHPRARIHIDAEPSLTATFDPTLLEEILLELIANAVEASVQDTVRIDLKLARCPRGMQFTIEDDGPGFEGADLEALFEPFHTLKAQGSGLGLALARRHTESLGGSLTAGTRADGQQGACFWLELPLV
jgi:two-component system sensor histidine kinase PilS (NtrC family)